jgi:5'-nucleotidase (lipoprotein e(P4) family)
VPVESIFGRFLPVIQNGSSRPMAWLVAVTALAAGCATAPPGQVNLDATLWVQTAAEYDAVTRSIYVAAMNDLSSLLSDSSQTAALEQDGAYSALPPAVILDVDETVLDNSPYQARLLVGGEAYSSDTWAEWVDERISTPVPGAVEFTNEASKRGIAVFYLTNRRKDQEQATRDNLAAWGFPLPQDMDVVLTRGERPDWGDKKGTRRRVVAQTHRVLMLFGDDLNDFVDVEGLSVEARDAVAESYGAYWGQRWRMLPNPTYGSWERALFDSDFKLSPAKRIDRKASHLEPKGESHE